MIELRRLNGAPTKHALSRRWVLGGTIAATGAVALAACGASGASPSEVAKTVAPAKIRFTTQNTDPPQSVNEEQVVNLFRERNKNVQVDYELYKGEDVRQKIIVQFAAGTAPDVADVETKWMPGLYVKNMVLDLTPHAKKFGIKADDYYAQEWEKAHIAGKLLCFPLDLQIYVMFYNKDMFQAKGVPLPPAKWDDPKWTWDEVLLRARQLAGGQGAQSTFAIDTSRSWTATYPYIWSNGGTILNKEKTKTTITDGATVDSIQFRADLINKHHVHPNPDELKAGGGALAMFINKQLAMESIWSPWAFQIAAKDTNVNYDLAPMPRGKTGSFTRAPSDSTIVLSGTKAPEAAALLASFVAGEEGQRRLVAQAGLGIPPLKKIARSDDFLKPKVPGAEGRNYQVVLDALEAQHYKFQDVTTAWDDMSKLIGDAHGNVLLGQMTASEMARSIAPQIDALLAQVTPDGRAFLGD